MENRLYSSHSLRSKGYIPLAILKGQKFPLNWKGFERNPVPIYKPFRSHNLGIRNDGIMPIDSDIEIPEISNLARQITKTWCEDYRIAEGPLRWRENSERWMMPFACPELDKSRLFMHTGVWKDSNGKTLVCVELKGGGSFQTLTHGVHPSGAPILWDHVGPDPVNMVAKQNLPVVTIHACKDLCNRLDKAFVEKLGPPTRKKCARKNFKNRYVLTDDMKFQDLDGTWWTVEKLKRLPRGVEVRCNLNGVRPNSNSKAGLARIGDAKELLIVDFAHDVIWRPAHPKGATKQQKALFNAIIGG